MSGTFNEAVNQSIAMTESAVPFRVTQNSMPTRVTGQPADPAGPDGVSWSGDRATIYVDTSAVVICSLNSRGTDSVLSIQTDPTMDVFVTYSALTAVMADVETAKAAGSDWQAQWSEVTLVGTPQAQVSLDGNITGIRFAGSGAAVLAKL